MKIESRTVTVTIDLDEWKMVEREYHDLKFGKKPYHYSEFPHLDDLLDSIHNVAQNQAMKIDRKINTY